MGLMDSINTTADVLKRNVPGLSPITNACRSTYDLGWTAVGKLGSAAGTLKENAPDLAPVKNACRASYDFGCTSAVKVNNAVRHTVGGTVTPYLPDEEGKARIGQFVTNFAKNSGHYACREGFKLVPGGGAFYKIVTQSIRAEKKTEDYRAVIKTLQARIEKLERESSGCTKSNSSPKILGSNAAEPDSRKALHSDVVYQKPEDVISIFMVKEFFGIHVLDDLVVPVKNNRRN